MAHYSTFTKKFVFLLAFIDYVQNLKFNSTNILLAINCGSKDTEKIDNVLFQKDQYYSSNSKTQSNDLLAKEHLYQEAESLLFSNLRYTNESSFTYELPLLKGPADYQLLLIFQELEYFEPNQRVFDIRIGDRFVIRNFDLYSIADNQPFVFPISITFTKDENILYQGRICNNAYKYQSNSLVLEFDTIEYLGHPFINAIVLFEGQDNQIQEYNNWEEFKKKQKEIAMMEQEKKKKKEEETWLGTIFSIKTLLILTSIIFFFCCCCTCSDEGLQKDDQAQESNGNGTNKHQKKKRRRD